MAYDFLARMFRPAKRPSASSNLKSLIWLSRSLSSSLSVSSVSSELEAGKRGNATARALGAKLTDHHVEAGQLVAVLLGDLRQGASLKEEGLQSHMATMEGRLRFREVAAPELISHDAMSHQSIVFRPPERPSVINARDRKKPTQRPRDRDNRVEMPVSERPTSRAGLF